MAKEEKLNINEEFDKLLPPTERKSLFDDDEDYNSFRLYIMQQPRGFYTNSKNKLPFSDIKLSSYLEYKSLCILIFCPFLKINFDSFKFIFIFDF